MDIPNSKLTEVAMLSEVTLVADSSAVSARLQVNMAQGGQGVGTCQRWYMI
jgi:hypothetical protein